MDDAAAVGFLHGSGDFQHRDSSESFGHLFLSIDVARQRIAFDQRHRDVMGAIHLAHIEDRAEVGVGKICSRPGFAVEAIDKPRLGMGIEFRNFQCDFTVKLGVMRPINRAHATATQERFDSVPPQNRGRFVVRKVGICRVRIDVVLSMGYIQPLATC